MFSPQGIYVAMLTPFNQEGGLNEAEVRRMVDFNIERGVDGLFPVSSVGEFIHLSFEEKVRLMEVVVDQTAGRVPVTPGVGSSEPAHSIRLAKAAKDLGCRAAVVAPPYYYSLDQEMVEKYFETIADGVDLPLILYNIPLFTQPISYDVVKRLARRPNIVAMKDSSGSMVDFMHFMDKIRVSGDKLDMLTGREETLLACLLMGGRGCMTATSGILPEIMVGIHKAWQEGNLEEARKLQVSILNPVRAMFALPFPVGFKLALETRGFEMGPPKQPLSDAHRFNYLTVKSRIQKVMRPILAGLEKAKDGRTA